jgi:hypothetical protein
MITLADWLAALRLHATDLIDIAVYLIVAYWLYDHIRQTIATLAAKTVYLDRQQGRTPQAAPSEAPPSGTGTPRALADPPKAVPIPGADNAMFLVGPQTVDLISNTCTCGQFGGCAHRDAARAWSKA